MPNKKTFFQIVQVVGKGVGWHYICLRSSHKYSQPCARNHYVSENDASILFNLLSISLWSIAFLFAAFCVFADNWCPDHFFRSTI